MIQGTGFLDFSIARMCGVSPGEGIRSASKADTAVKAVTFLLSFGQLRTCGFSVIAQFHLHPAFGCLAQGNTTEFCFAVQLAVMEGSGLRRGGFVLGFAD